MCLLLYISQGFIFPTQMWYYFFFFWIFQNFDYGNPGVPCANTAKFALRARIKIFFLFNNLPFIWDFNILEISVLFWIISYVFIKIIIFYLNVFNTQRHLNLAPECPNLMFPAIILASSPFPNRVTKLGAIFPYSII